MKRAASSLACLILLAPMLTAASINFVGIESGNEVQNWSNPAIAKTHDLNGDDLFGAAGHYQIMPATAAEIETTVLTASPGNDLGISLNLSGAAVGTLNTAFMTPHFLSGIPAGAAGEFINTPDFPNFSDPSGASYLRQGSLWLNEPVQVGMMPGGATGYSNTAFSFTLSKVAAFRLGVAVDSMSFDGASPDYVSISKVGGGNVFSDPPINRDGVSDMVFFDINGSAGDVFVVKLWQADPNRTAFGLITFDQLPIAATPTLICTQADGNIILSWEQNIPGWILESSTDLGVGDNWDTVPYPNNNNRVIVPLAGTPKNFFRLKKSP